MTSDDEGIASTTQSVGEGAIVPYGGGRDNSISPSRGAGCRILRRNSYNNSFRGRCNQNLSGIQNTDEDFARKIEEIRVIGMPFESNLKQGLAYEDFVDYVILYLSN